MITELRKILFGIESFTFEIYVCHKSSLLTLALLSLYIVCNCEQKIYYFSFGFSSNLLFISCAEDIDSQRVVTETVTETVTALIIIYSRTKEYY